MGSIGLLTWIGVGAIAPWLVDGSDCGWTELSCADAQSCGAPRLAFHSTVALEDTLFVFGGLEGDDEVATNEAWALSIPPSLTVSTGNSSNTSITATVTPWRRLCANCTTHPRAQYDAALAAVEYTDGDDVARRSLFVIGGRNYNVNRDFWRLDLSDGSPGGASEDRWSMICNDTVSSACDILPSFTGRESPLLMASVGMRLFLLVNPEPSRPRAITSIYVFDLETPDGDPRWVEFCAGNSSSSCCGADGCPDLFSTSYFSPSLSVAADGKSIVAVAAYNHGEDGGPWAFDTDARRWRRLCSVEECPHPFGTGVTSRSAALHPDLDLVFVFGDEGNKNGPSNDLWSLSFDDGDGDGRINWTLACAGGDAAGVAPSIRQYHSTTIVPRSAPETSPSLIVYGGYHKYIISADAWLYDLSAYAVVTPVTPATSVPTSALTPTGTTSSAFPSSTSAPTPASTSTATAPPADAPAVRIEGVTPTGLDTGEVGAIVASCVVGALLLCCGGAHIARRRRSAARKGGAKAAPWWLLPWLSRTPTHRSGAKGTRTSNAGDDVSDSSSVELGVATRVSSRSNSISDSRHSATRSSSSRSSASSSARHGVVARRDSLSDDRDRDRDREDAALIDDVAPKPTTTKTKTLDYSDSEEDEDAIVRRLADVTLMNPEDVGTSDSEDTAQRGIFEETPTRRGSLSGLPAPHLSKDRGKSRNRIDSRALPSQNDGKKKAKLFEIDAYDVYHSDSDSERDYYLMSEDEDEDDEDDDGEVDDDEKERLIDEHRGQRMGGGGAGDAFGGARVVVVNGEECVACNACGKTFKEKCNLITHQREQHRERVNKYVCQVCHKGFYRKHNLRVHELTHLASNNFQCDACAKTFAQKANYIRHMNNTHERPAKCPLCSFRVTSDTEFASHLKEKHPAADPAKVKLRVRGHRGVTCFCGQRFDSLDAKVAHQVGCPAYAETIARVETIRRSEGTVATARRAAAAAAAAAALANREETDHSRALSHAQEKFADSLIPEELITPTKRKQASPSVVQIKHEVGPRGANTQARTNPQQAQSHHLGHLAAHAQSQEGFFALDNEGMSPSSSGAAANTNVALHSTAAFRQNSSLAPVSSVEGYSESKQQHEPDFNDLYPHDSLSLDFPSRPATAVSSHVEDTAVATAEVGPADLSLSERIAQHNGTGEIPISSGTAGLLDLSSTAVSRGDPGQREPGRRHDASSGASSQSQSQSRSPVREMPSALRDAQFSSSSSAAAAQGSLVMEPKPEEISQELQDLMMQLAANPVNSPMDQSVPGDGGGWQVSSPGGDSDTPGMAGSSDMISQQDLAMLDQMKRLLQQKQQRELTQLHHNQIQLGQQPLQNMPPEVQFKQEPHAHSRFVTGTSPGLTSEETGAAYIDTAMKSHDNEKHRSGRPSLGMKAEQTAASTASSHLGGYEFKPTVSSNDHRHLHSRPSLSFPAVSSAPQTLSLDDAQGASSELGYSLNPSPGQLNTNAAVVGGNLMTQAASNFSHIQNSQLVLDPIAQASVQPPLTLDSSSVQSSGTLSLDMNPEGEGPYVPSSYISMPNSRMMSSSSLGLSNQNVLQTIVPPPDTVMKPEPSLTPTNLELGGDTFSSGAIPDALSSAAFSTSSANMPATQQLYANPTFSSADFASVSSVSDHPMTAADIEGHGRQPQQQVGLAAPQVEYSLPVSPNADELPTTFAASSIAMVKQLSASSLADTPNQRLSSFPQNMSGPMFPSMESSLIAPGETLGALQVQSSLGLGSDFMSAASLAPVSPQPYLAVQTFGGTVSAATPSPQHFQDSRRGSHSIGGSQFMSSAAAAAGVSVTPPLPTGSTIGQLSDQLAADEVDTSRNPFFVSDLGGDGQ